MGNSNLVGFKVWLFGMLKRSGEAADGEKVWRRWWLKCEMLHGPLVFSRSRKCSKGDRPTQRWPTDWGAGAGGGWGVQGKCIIASVRYCASIKQNLAVRGILEGGIILWRLIDLFCLNSRFQLQSQQWKFRPKGLVPAFPSKLHSLSKQQCCLATVTYLLTIVSPTRAAQFIFKTHLTKWEIMGGKGVFSLIQVPRAIYEITAQLVLPL